ncbi:aldehyde dehydrogenase family protein [Vagococcus sp. PNs007]|uniref:Aldehyde dehydrogenase family protein n=1 Tax=Vagococcus proximus TaxID=2991417 RepID=A0ABT5X3F7_9ENTE|nr:aldehyde dehydrogenase family protein [Vagococcus proximus]MDF0480447.1 aldehyde dehydrogenase family protein [Vagococcus proximus]
MLENKEPKCVVEKEIEGMIDNARIAQVEFEKWSQEDVDRVVKAIGKAVYGEGEKLARMAIEETGMGKYEDKINKNKGKSKAVWKQLSGIASRRIIKRNPEEELIEVAKPIGVIGAVTPVTNPSMTPIHNAMIALKGGNAIIFSPHPKAKNTGIETVNIMREALFKEGASKDLLQIVKEPSLLHTTKVMELCDASIATGGPAMVKAAYSSGKPSFGVGAGNVQCVLDRKIDYRESIDKVIAGRIYDNGILCTCEQTLIYPQEIKLSLIDILKEKGGYLIKEDEMPYFRKHLFPGGKINVELVGKSPSELGRIIDMTIPKDTKFIFVMIDEYGEKELFTKEKLCPVLSVIGYESWNDALNIAKTNLLFEGAGHSAVIHSNNTDHIEEFGIVLPISRLVVNQQGSSALGGSLNNGLNPTATLGCGSWGNNSLSENLWWHHLVNISRISYEIKDKEDLSDKEIWDLK